MLRGREHGEREPDEDGLPRRRDDLPAGAAAESAKVGDSGREDTPDPVTAHVTWTVRSQQSRLLNRVAELKTQVRLGTWDV
jgi:hypothetical protein